MHPHPLFIQALLADREREIERHAQAAGLRRALRRRSRHSGGTRV